ncbi:undecaprenyl-diphosphatase [Arcticibacter tournemirensis]|uniref:Phosphatase PAP2 family protein n=1 Tax=Arcticibacter tournemirensis TaxID=699437 RepID=A0A5M9HJN4_9SPHI|nr:phosphatase PAP2 family protein [Arcticibacter tournemirensis]KAA8485578.1 phosphatase PAP2 family protein [Arcticibacter tournemirensis]TQM48705.1 undecaprenyl-diphosphatase [Arcticibacter tournemirensis]
MKYNYILCLLLLFFTASAVKAQNLDLRLLENINGPANPQWDGKWRAVTNSAIPISIATPVALFVAGQIDHNQNLKEQSYVALGSLAGSALLSTLSKAITRRDRPFVNHGDVIFAKSFPTDYSFPSGHTTVAFSTATTLSLSFPKWYVIVPAYTYAASVGYSRMYLGVHYPSDVLGGAILGSASAYITYRTNKWLRRDRKHKQLSEN